MGYDAPADARAYLAAGAIPLRRIRQLVAGASERGVRVILIVDGCYVGEPPDVDSDMAGLDLAFGWRGATRLMATQAGQTAQELAVNKPEGHVWHGAFTHFLLEGLAGQGDLNGDGRVTVAELALYIPEKLRDSLLPQRPQFAGPLNVVLAAP